MIRISGGTLKGRYLQTPEGTLFRPTKSLVRQSLMNAIDFNETCMLDLCCGSGAVGVEALSHGAKHVTFVDSNPKVIQYLKNNLTKLEVDTNRYSIVAATIEKFLKKPPQSLHLSISRIFWDPPYIKNTYDKTYDDILSLLERSGLMENDALLVIEGPQDFKVISHNSWRLEKTKTYGQTSLQYWQKHEI
jgi:16S rRNA (guanine966-N2)-methyltransferase